MGGTEVGGTDVLVGGTDVLVGAMRVAVGWKVGITPVRVGPGTRVRGVAVEINVTVGEGVTVKEGVAVGIVGVRVGRSDGVAVGLVAVGNGPRRASEVSARAVLVVLALRNRLASPGAPPNVNQIHRSAASKRASIRAARVLSRFPVVKFTVIGFLFPQTYG